MNSEPKLFNYQVPHVEALIAALMHHNVALDASDLGTGKTICACEIAKRLNKELIVVGKKIMKPTWIYWMERWGVSGVVGNWEMARRRGLPVRDNAIFVFDEVHEAGGYKTLNAKLLVNVYERGLPLLLLSATAIESPLRMWALGYLFGFHNLRDFYRWGFKNGVKRNYGYPGFHFDGSSEVLTRINKKIFPHFGSRMRKAEIPDFPECQYVLELVEPEDSDKLARWKGMIDVREAQHQAKMDEAAEEEGMPYANPAYDILPEILFARMRAELSKVPVLIDETLEALEEGLSVVIFINFLPTLDALWTLLELPVGTISGDQKPDERQEQIDAFQSDKFRVMLSTIDSGGAGISLHDVTGVHPRLSLVCPTWRATTLRQALGRVHRAGGKTKTLQKLLYASGSIEENIADRVREKLSQIDSINDADLAEPEFSYA
jgi:superfamily II DNA or RNA helicase